MADKVEINSIVHEALQGALKEHTNMMNNHFEGMLSHAMEKLTADLLGQLQLSSSVFPAKAIPSPDNAGKGTDRTSIHVNPFEGVIITGASSDTSLVVPTPRANPVAGGVSEEAMKAIAQMKQQI